MEPITFIFLLTVWSADTPAPDVYVEDSGLTIEDCGDRLRDYNAAHPAWENGIPSCEIDLGDWTGTEPPQEYAICADDACADPLILPACAFEDSDNCVWDARHRGNGIGQSFYSLGGKIYPLNLED